MKECHRVKVMTDIKIILEPYINVWRFETGTYLEIYERKAKEWAKEFLEFYRDHRSQDKVDVSVVPEYKDKCSECEEDLEVIRFEADEETPEYSGCANCGAKFVVEALKP